MADIGDLVKSVVTHWAQSSVIFSQAPWLLCVCRS